MKRLETDRLILRKFTEDDAKGMFENWASDAKTTKYVSFNPHKSIYETKEIIKQWIAEYESGAFNWIVELKESGDVIGSISVINMSTKHSNCELGYAYGSKFWNKGYATEALRTVIKYLLEECNIHLVEAKHHSSNPASGRVMEKAKMRKDGVLRERRKTKLNEEYDDLIVYSIIKEDL